MKLLCREGSCVRFAVLLGLLTTSAALADAIFETNYLAGTMGEYTTSGATVNASLVSRLIESLDIAIITPEPSTLAPIGLGLAGLGLCSVKCRTVLPPCSRSAISTSDQGARDRTQYATQMDEDPGISGGIPGRPRDAYSQAVTKLQQGLLMVIA
jgi:hypothetical protein